MGWLDKIFGNKEPPARPGVAPSASAPFDDGEDEGASTEIGGRHNAPRRDLVQVVLRDTMRRHGIPSDWIESRILSVMSTRRGGEGMHVLLVVRQGDDRLAPYVHAFQQTFMEELLKFEPKARDWVFSVSWQFEGKPRDGHGSLPDPASWSASGQSTQAGLAREGSASDAGSAPEGEADGSADASASPAAETTDSQLEEDLQALFRIRDEALKTTGAPDTEPQEAAASPPDFEPTRPGFDESNPPPRK
ncbi:MAG TPA: hypothetical protein VHA82_04930 [Ramlibacter sp.]|uniref:hypothetical protein n=1 Tax=Ramlibacter sp. TaxID=1917967 RepID=UPI002C2DD05C|nr:hypothetical protein [Ramlibacter sp.]HVZ43134.1 hypothetical protein [Ramlibacter sp.]